MPEAQATARTEEEISTIAVQPAQQTAHERFGEPKNFINRELSWLEFNRRVLEEAQDQRQPLIERVKFLTIVSSNLDEFFEIRVAGIKQQIESETSDVGPDGLSPSEVFDRIQKTVRQLVAAQYTLWNSDFLPVSGWVRTIGWRAPGTFETSSTVSNPLCARPPLECVAAWIICRLSMRFLVASGNVS